MKNMHFTACQLYDGFFRFKMIIFFRSHKIICRCHGGLSHLRLVSSRFDASESGVYLRIHGRYEIAAANSARRLKSFSIYFVKVLDLFLKEFFDFHRVRVQWRDSRNAAVLWHT